ncbi:MAG: B12-binding domain-containing protein [Desulfococcaceae bacterium]
MESSMNQLLESARKLPPIPPREAAAYRAHMNQLISDVDEALASEPDIHELIGHNPLRVMYENHNHHAHFMSTVFSIGNYELLAKTVPWVYRAYRGHRFSYDYFPRELRAWMAAIRNRIADVSMEAVPAVYQWMIDAHETMIALSRSELPFEMPVDEHWLETRNAFQEALLNGEYPRCLDIARKAVADPDRLESFYLLIIQPALYEVGRLWERGDISVANEHIASAIVARIMAALRSALPLRRLDKGRAVISASSNEFHEIGAWMVSDILEQDGWDVRYVGANTPREDLLDLLRQFKPQFLALSVTMPFNIQNAADIVQGIRNDPKLASVRVMVGGNAFSQSPDLWRATGADAYAASFQDARRLAAEWADSGPHGAE